MATPARTGPKPARVALVIGNSAYPRALPNPARDAGLVTDKLERVGFHTIIGGAESYDSKMRKRNVARNGQDLDRAAMWQRVNEFLAEIGDGTEAVIYYAGHGIQDRDQNYIVPIDATLESNDPVAELIPLDYVIQHAVTAAGKNGKVIVFLDACRTNPFTPSQLQSLAEGAGRSMTSSAAQQSPAQGAASTTARGLAPQPVAHAHAADHCARTFIAYATAPGAVAYDGEATDLNSPFATALGRHLCTRGLPLAELVDRIGLDVQDRVEAMNRERVQDPWTTTNLKNDYFFEPATWRPMIWMGIMGLIAGLFTCYFVFPNGELINPYERPAAWAIGLFFAVAVGIGTWRWGSGRPRDILFAVIGCTLAFDLAMVVLQLIVNAPIPTPRPQSDVARLENTFKAFSYATLAAGALMMLGTIMGWKRERIAMPGVWHAALDLALPFMLMGTLYSLQLRLFEPKQTVIVLIALIAGILFTAGTALSLKTQRSVFRGFGALTGAITVGLTMAILFDGYLRMTDANTGRLTDGAMLLAVILGTFWFGLLGAQIGYCFMYFVPERSPLKLSGRKN